MCLILNVHVSFCINITVILEAINTFKLLTKRGHVILICRTFHSFCVHFHVNPSPLNRSKVPDAKMSLLQLSINFSVDWKYFE